MSFGIDFGTTNSVVAYWNGSEAEALPIDDRNLDQWNYPGFELLFPSVVGISSTRPGPLFGWEAKLRSEAQYEAVKRMLRGDGTVPIGTHSFAASTVAAGMFHAMRERVEQQLLNMDEAVVTVPANSAGAARYRTRAAARIAGLQVKALLNEPTAAAISYVHEFQDGKQILVFDWGGGTVDVTVLDYADGVFEERASRGIPQLGGIELDNRLCDLVTRKLKFTPAWSPSQARQFHRDIERAKILLSTEEVVAVTTPDFRDTVDVTRKEFETAIADLIEQSTQPLRTSLRDIGVSPDEIDAVLMIGGTSQIPAVRAMVADIMGEEPVSSLICEPLTAVARGAAVAAAILDGKVEGNLAVATTHALGTTVRKDGKRTFSQIIPRNSSLPKAREKSYTPNSDNQETLKIEIWEGDPDQPLDSDANVLLTALTLRYPYRMPREDGRFLLRYEYNTSGILRVRATLEKFQRIIFDKEIENFSEKGSGTGVSKNELQALLRMNSASPTTPAAPTPATAAQQIKPVLRRESASRATNETKCFVVDGSNLAWLGHNRSQPSYAQLSQAIEQLRIRHPEADIRIVVDATFRHKVSDAERVAVEDALGDGRLIQPPAGATGRGDALVAEIAAQLDAIVVTNDNFSELQHIHPWLLDKGRVLGASRTGDLWVFLDRVPRHKPWPGEGRANDVLA